ncbi:rhodanese-like domain-containing protein [Advenella sp. RU8]|uniref:rhodanese-like domain-containing protein n=1 Tax=Advenella sp. RU8 TaxID=3399575 RepID=UPI003AAEA813
MIVKLKYSMLAVIVLLAPGATTFTYAQTDIAPVVQNKKQESIWIDVRTPAEFASGHLSNAINIEYQDLGSEIMSVTQDRSMPINLYCRSGRRAEIARQVLLKMGYVNVINHGSYEQATKLTAQN